MTIIMSFERDDSSVGYSGEMMDDEAGADLAHATSAKISRGWAT